jgi:Uma2 family endonuclease
MRQKLVMHTLKPVGLTDEEFFAFCVANKGLRVERDKKREISICLLWDSENGELNIRLTDRIISWNDRNNLGIIVDASGGFTLLNDAVWVADVA